eukprot:Nitzschia sp. Nitz4//scaffold169_size48518//44621//48512//NITZ4_007081-RA/size48518-processed-gene-0.84-mRNA-1//1//CDS//3329538415//8375//frame0
MSEGDLSFGGIENNDFSMDSKGQESEGDETTSMMVRESKQLRQVRFVFTILLLLVAVGLAFGIFYLTRENEKSVFESTFEDRANKVIDSFHARVELKVGAMATFSSSITSYANFRNLTWPFVTVPDFAIKGATTRSLSHSVWTVILPFVAGEDKEAWEAYSTANQGWLDEDASLQITSDGRSLEEEDSTLLITYTDEFGNIVPTTQEGPYFPSWQSSPAAARVVNFDLASSADYSSTIDHTWEHGEAVFAQSDDSVFLSAVLGTSDEWANDKYFGSTGPLNRMMLPIFDSLDVDEREPVGVLYSLHSFESYMIFVLPEDQGGLYAVITSECNQTYTYAIHGKQVTYIGEGDLHKNTFSDSFITDTIFQFADDDDDVGFRTGIESHDICNYTLYLYPSHELESEFITSTPWLFFALNYQETYRKAKQAGAIVSSIFPAAVRKRLYQEDNSTENQKIHGQGAFKQSVPSAVDTQKARLKGFLTENQTMLQANMNGRRQQEADDAEEQEKPLEKPIADLFPATTILFADIVGFTAWSSQREPGEVFTLLQTLYQDFDSIARMLKVFKVETIGDCYVAATGLPEPQDDHALRMARFATKIMSSMIDVTRQLEVRLGPDTGELRIRVGMHSGPVTAGVLKGNKARFQLFGDTMNFAARMEHHSLPSRIQCSEATAELIRKAGKDTWVRPREDKVTAKGKGELQTYWVLPRIGTNMAGNGGSHDPDEYNAPDEDYANPWGTTKLVFDLGTPGNRYQRLIDWNVELLAGLLKHIEAQRSDMRLGRASVAPIQLRGGSTALDEVTEIITLPQFAMKGMKRKTRPDDIELSVEVITQLRDYVTTIASMYRDNAFHNFEHASHVTMSTNKLLKRVTVRDADHGDDIAAMALHDYTYGITSDPLTQFTLVFCALVHDVDHAGVSNFQLIKEGATIAKLYKNKSVAEQNSVDLAWDLLMDPNYKELQKAIYASDEELKRFRQLMVNIVLATDIFDADMKAIRERRWGKAFQVEEDDEEEEKLDLPVKAIDERGTGPLQKMDGANLKATIVMEHLIQASDVAHTMQHWQIYLKWNERLFNEMYTAYDQGRAAKDPSVGWYEGEIMFFDKYVVPLARKLDDCGVFGVASDECLNYATQNRKQWALKGD